MIKKILDAGSGLGSYIYKQSQKFPGEYYGIDIDEGNISISQQNYPNIKFKQMSVEELAFPDNFFDLIYSRDVLEHVDFPHQTIKEMVRVLKPSGRLLIQIPAKNSERWLLKIRPTYHQEIHHQRIYEDDEIETIATPFGLKLVRKFPKDFTDHFYLYFVFKYADGDDHQTGVGSWKGYWWGVIVAPIHGYLSKEIVFDTWLRFIPIWLITLPLSWLINLVGNKFMPKSWYYEFKKE